jgi:hypothetical protein
VKITEGVASTTSLGMLGVPGGWGGGWTREREEGAGWTREREEGWVDGVEGGQVNGRKGGLMGRRVDK